MEINKSNRVSQSGRSNLSLWYTESKASAQLKQQLLLDTTHALERLFGYHTVFLGVVPNQKVLRTARTQTTILAIPDLSNATDVSSVQCDAEFLPFASESIDTVVVSHGLDVAATPHRALREIDRILVPGGNLIIIGFNPHSMLGLIWWWRRFFTPSRWRNIRPLRMSKLRDWLGLLNFQCEKPKFQLVLPIFGGRHVAKQLASFDHWLVDHQIPFGGTYLLQARKQIGAGIAVPAKKVQRPHLVPISVSRPTVGVEHHRTQKNAIVNEDG